jgi:hypothetical protein
MNIRPYSFVVTGVLLLFPVSASAQLESVLLSPDITLNLANVVTRDENVAADNLAGIVVPVDIGVIPANADLSVYHLLDNGDSLLAFDITVSLPGAVVAQPVDVVRRSGGVYSIEFDGSAQGVPAGARLDALSANAQGHLLMSFDTTVALPGLTASDEDIVAFNGANFTMLFDGSAAGLESGVDLDALHFSTGNGRLFVSFDIGGVIGGANFSDEDLLEHDPVGNTWALAYNGSAEHAAWIPGDLDAAFVMFLVGFIFKDGFENP